MTGPEHYLKAEQLLVKAYYGGDKTELIATAQVHATLALAAATYDVHPTATAGFGRVVDVPGPAAPEPSAGEA